MDLTIEQAHALKFTRTIKITKIERKIVGAQAVSQSPAEPEVRGAEGMTPERADIPDDDKTEGRKNNE